MDNDAREHSQNQVSTRGESPESDKLEALQVPAAITSHVRNLARRYGLGSFDREDVRQELSVALWRAMRRYDPSRASRETFRERVLDLECLAIARRMRALRRRDARVAEAVREIARRGIAAKSTVERDHAIRAALASLNDRQRQIGHGLMAGESISAIARRLGVHRATVHRGAVEVRRQLADARFEDFAT